MGCCGDKQLYDLQTQGCCGSSVYDFTKQGCCSGSVYNKKRQSCCGGLTYDKRKQQCCADGLVSLTGRCCKTYPHLCCSGAIATATTNNKSSRKIACQGKCGMGTQCCGSTAYDASKPSQKCCSNYQTFDSDTQQCYDMGRDSNPGSRYQVIALPSLCDVLCKLSSFLQFFFFFL